MRKLPLLLLLASLLLAACGTPQTPLDGAELARQGTLTAQQGQAYQAAILAATRTAEANLQATQQVIAGTTAAQNATANAITATAENAIAEATRHALALAATSDAAAVSAAATRSAIESQGTAAAVAALADLDRQMMNGEATRQALVLRQEEATAERAETWAEFVRFARWVAVALLVLVAAAVWRLYQLRRRPVVVIENGREHVLYDPHHYQRLTVGRPEPAGLLEAGTVQQGTAVTLPELQGHVLIAGETNSGKSTAMLAVLKQRRNVVVLDPHDDGHTWGSARVIGGGRDFKGIAGALDQMRNLLHERFTERSYGKEEFDPITVATDEMPAIVSSLGKDVYTVWREWLREGRKVGLFLCVSTQSTRVKTLGIQGEGDLLENFAAVLVLGQLAVNEYGNLVRGMERPAVLRTMQGVNPVIIPYTPPSASARFDYTPPPIEVVSNRPALEAAEPEEPELTPEEENRNRRIAAMLQEGFSMNEIQRQVFHYDQPGGRAYKIVKEIRDQLVEEGKLR